MSKYNWPTREEWAEQQRTLYWDHADDIRDRVSKRLSDYATAEEIAAAIGTLEEILRQYGRRLREVNQQGRALLQQPGESLDAYFKREQAMPEADQAVVQEAGDLRFRPRYIKQTVQELRANKVPYATFHAGKEARAVIEFIHQRHKAACDLAVEAAVEKVAQTPIDDAAWQKELEWRRDIEENGVVRFAP